MKNWQVALDWIIALDASLPQRWPSALPPESAPGFWWDVVRHEQATRDAVSGWLRQRLKAEGQAPPVDDLQAFFVRRRIEWSAQLVLGACQQQMEPPQKVAELLDWLLIQTWEKDGHEALWNHSERDGKPHPENPDGLSPLP